MEVQLPAGRNNILHRFGDTAGFFCAPHHNFLGIIQLLCQVSI